MKRGVWHEAGWNSSYARLPQFKQKQTGLNRNTSRLNVWRGVRQHIICNTDLHSFGKIETLRASQEACRLSVSNMNIRCAVIFYRTHKQHFNMSEPFRRVSFKSNHNNWTYPDYLARWQQPILDAEKRREDLTRVYTDSTGFDGDFSRCLVFASWDCLQSGQVGFSQINDMSRKC